MDTTLLNEPVAHPAAWVGPEIARRPDEWIYRLGAEDLADVEQAVRQCRARNLKLESITREDFPLPKFAPRLAKLLDEIRNGRGFVLMRGLGDPRFDRDDLAIAYWGIGCHLGIPATQNADHHLLGHVRDEGRAFGKALDARGYHSNARLEFHVDGAEIIGLLCLHPAKAGGKSSLVSGVAVYNELLRRHPRHMPTLARGYKYIKREAAFTSDPVSPHRLPVFGRVGDQVACRFVRTKIEAASVKTGEPLSAEEVAALDAFEEVARDPALRLDMDFQVGDIQLINNYTVLHARTEFEDWPEPERKRHLLRLWLTYREAPVLPKGFPRHLGYQQENSEIAYLSDWREREAAFA
ncbi:MAG TPA: TauD/TfdA family dioxygenase [Usitatibacter sp.]|nr:TauD/TfdA family dioxygenase [Usitatibacter sp.]